VCVQDSSKCPEISFHLVVCSVAVGDCKRAGGIGGVRSGGDWCCPMALVIVRGIAAGIVAGYELGDRGAGVRVPVGSSFFTSP
jgi:hypothetical protein